MDFSNPAVSDLQRVDYFVNTERGADESCRRVGTGGRDDDANHGGTLAVGTAVFENCAKEKVVSRLQHMDEEQLAPIVKALMEKHARAVAEGEEKRLEISRDFFDEATRRKRMKMAEGEMEMKFLRTDIERVEKLLREELKVLKRSYTEAEGRTGGGEEEEEDDDDDGEDVADMLRFVPQLPGYEGDACDEDEEFERKYHAGLSSLYTKGIKEIDGVNSSMRGKRGRRRQRRRRRRWRWKSPHRTGEYRRENERRTVRRFRAVFLDGRETKVWTRAHRRRNSQTVLINVVLVV